MKIGVVSDTHNNLKNIDKIIALFNAEKISTVIHTGDIASAKALQRFANLNSQLIGVYGNNDRNESDLKEMACTQNFSFQEPPRMLTMCEKVIAIFHEPDPIDKFLLENNNVDIVVHGHTHRYLNEKRDGVLYFNPGESAGIIRGGNAIGILDLANFKAKRIFF